MPEVHISSHDNNIEKDLRNFKRKVDKAGLPALVRQKWPYPPTAENEQKLQQKTLGKEAPKRKRGYGQMIVRALKTRQKTKCLVERVKADSAGQERKIQPIAYFTSQLIGMTEQH